MEKTKTRILSMITTKKPNGDESEKKARARK